jgi:Holliday junction resolvase|tara:strand:+ start:4300 stop:4737 length:438 start_codon:yes stop_codon:yes gene_type:complete
MNSKQKGARGERLWRDVIRAQGYEAIRGCQNAGRFAGGQEAPDVITNLPFHFEVKFVEKLNVSNAMAQAVGDADKKFPVVAHKKSREDWLVTMNADLFFQIVRGEIPITEEGEQASERRKRNNREQFQYPDGGLHKGTGEIKPSP